MEKRFCLREYGSIHSSLLQTNSLWKEQNQVSDAKENLPTGTNSSMSSNQAVLDNLPNKTKQKTYDALVLEARLRQSLMAVRSLGRRGLQVAALETIERTPTFSSRWCKKAFICPTDGSAHAYVNCLEQVLDCNNVGVLISSSDANIELIRQHRTQLEQKVRIALAKEPALGIALNKAHTLEIAKKLGLLIPRAILIDAVSEVERAIREIGLPAVVKPVQSWSWDNQRGTGLSS